MSRKSKGILPLESPGSSSPRINGPGMALTNPAGAKQPSCIRPLPGGQTTPFDLPRSIDSARQSRKKFKILVSCVFSPPASDERLIV